MRLSVHNARFALPLAAAAVLGGLALLPFAASRSCADAPTLAPRKPWITSRIVGSPEPPPPFRTVQVFPKVRLNHPLLLTRAPGTDRLFVGEQDGRLYSIANRPDATAEPFLDLTKELRTLQQHPGAKGVEAVYGLTFHPKFAENRYCYVCYTLRGKKNEPNLPDGTRVSRFRVTTADPPRAVPESEEIVITWLQGGHNGGDIHFGPDGMLYISTGDATDPSPPDKFKTGQDISDLLSSVLRIDVDHRDPGKNYAAPKDNPFVDLKGARPEVWAYGFRNPWRMSFDRQTGELWVGDVGWELWEMVHRAEKGGNYGWSIVEAHQPINTDLPPGPTPIRPPVIELPHTAAASVTGGYVYRGKKFPELVGAYIFGDWETKRLWAARIQGDRVLAMPEIAEPTLRIVAFGEDHAGELYIVDYDAGTIHTLARNDAPVAHAPGSPADFPRTLSATGLFASVPQRRPAEGVLPFEVSAARWADYATPERLLALPGTSAVTWHPRDVEIPGSMFSRRFEFPTNGVLAETFVLERECGNPASRKPIETQILHYDGKLWRGYSYAWNDAGTDAELVPADGGERTLTVADPAYPGGQRVQTWAFPSRAQCFVCHNPWTQTTLGFNIAQLNRDSDAYGPRLNQLAALEAMGALKRLGDNNKPAPPLDAKTLAEQPRLADPADAHADLAARTRAYLHANCGHCHRFGGGGAVELELHAFLPLDKMKVLDVPPRQGPFDLPDARIIAPGEPIRSVLYYRMAKFGRGRMPHVGSEIPDEFGLALVHDWIKHQPAKDDASAASNGDAPGALTVEEINRRLASPATALALARFVARHRLPAAVRDSVLAHAAKLSPGTVRDLFEGYLPQTGERKLGSNPRPAAILALTGDPERGRALFQLSTMQCLNCHRLGAEGKELGPDLSAIGKSRTRPELLESLLDPSRRIDPPYVPYQVMTKRGRSVSGLLVKRDAQGVVLRDAQLQEVRLRADEIDHISPSRQSLMPDGLLRDLTAQQAADLLDFLAARR
jgi:putative heme-binding domain-containing protein